MADDWARVRHRGAGFARESGTRLCGRGGAASNMALNGRPARIRSPPPLSADVCRTTKSHALRYHPGKEDADDPHG